VNLAIFKTMTRSILSPNIEVKSTTILFYNVDFNRPCHGLNTISQCISIQDCCKSMTFAIPII
jgi:hypothetical protein